MAANKLERIDQEIQKMKNKISDYQERLKELETQKTETENLQIITLVRSLHISPEELKGFLESEAGKPTPTLTPFHGQEGIDEE